MIKIGDHLPNATFTVMTPDGPKPVTTQEYFAGKKIVLFGVPGAFTPTCHRNHLPGFRDKASEIKARGVDAIAVVSVNDVFVMNAWAENTAAKGIIDFLADGSAAFAKAIGLSLDLNERGLGMRMQRFSMLVDNGVVKKLSVEEGTGTTELSGADAMLAAL
jgi:peroxiredoxin